MSTSVHSSKNNPQKNFTAPNTQCSTPKQKPLKVLTSLGIFGIKKGREAMQRNWLSFQKQQAIKWKLSEHWLQIQGEC